MTAVSSDRNTPRNVEVPVAKAASTNARFVMLFEPGISTTACTGVVRDLNNCVVRLINGLYCVPGRRRLSINRVESPGDYLDDASATVNAHDIKPALEPIEAVLCDVRMR
jgi:hypothetical protein